MFPRPDGVRARCGGPGICAECSRDQVRLDMFERTLVRLRQATDSNGAMIRLTDGHTAQSLRDALLRHLALFRDNPKKTVFLGKNGEEKFWENASLMIDALVQALTIQGGSELNHVVPGFGFYGFTPGPRTEQ